MILLKKILNIFINILIFCGFIKKKTNSLRILMFHDISDLDKFEKIIIHLMKEWKFISPQTFFEIYKNKKKIKKNLILLTFDDGFKSNILAANQILSKHKIKAIFFVPFYFINLKKILEKKKFIRNNLKIKTENNKLNNMNLSDLKSLIKQKHQIGAHTYSHKDLKSSKNMKKLKFEIVLSTNKFEKQINKKINLFAFNFGRLKNISSQMMTLANKRYDFLFTGVRGQNNLNSKLLFRDNISLEDNIFDINAYLNGTYDFMYENERKKLFFYLTKC